MERVLAAVLPRFPTVPKTTDAGSQEATTWNDTASDLVTELLPQQPLLAVVGPWLNGSGPLALPPYVPCPVVQQGCALRCHRS